jgi:hypothetical protein
VTCPADEPSACPTTGVPSYATDIAPLIATYCATAACHTPTGSAADQPMSTYNDLAHRLGEAHSQLYQCRMPLPPAPDPTLEERVTLLTWFVCGGPNN